MTPQFRRQTANTLEKRLLESPKRILIVAGPRQVGKSFLVRQVLNQRPSPSFLSVAADQTNPTPNFPDKVDFPLIEYATLDKDGEWIAQQWREAKARSEQWLKIRGQTFENLPFVLVIDEVQLIPQWSTRIKGLWDQAQQHGAEFHLVLLGSAPLLVQQGLNEALTGRYELLSAKHWSLAEMNEAFNFNLDTFVFYGGYPGSADLVPEPDRWRSYVQQALIEPSIERDIIAMARVDKPSMLRQLFELGCQYSSQILALNKVSQVLDGGHTLTLAHHLTLLEQAGLLSGIQKYAAQAIRQRRAAPKFQVHNTALIGATSKYELQSAVADRSYWGRLVESAVGSHLINTAPPGMNIFYWRQEPHEVDFILELQGKLVAIEVKSGKLSSNGLNAFKRLHPSCSTLCVGSDETPLGEFLSLPAAEWFR
jgi:uncharacterized protein